ncbi:MAG: hypothetical protein C0614_04745 [Desulfuromonas sp.]|nr:MAG: hypothetical protein C0614_04745 [Desulfuromonas sp.]
MKLSDFCKTLDGKLASSPADTTLRLSALALQQAFKVSEDEVAFMKIDPQAECLYFVWPAKLGKAGCIPLKTRDSLAAATVRDNRPQLNNRFSATYHASVFEQIRLDAPAKGKETDEPARPKIIQKIMSVPLFKAETVVGVAQVSRKGNDANAAGGDFTPAELDALSEIAKVIGSHI